jgi:tetratricopeptide (TPR) repeat protein
MISLLKSGKYPHRASFGFLLCIFLLTAVFAYAQQNGNGYSNGGSLYQARFDNGTRFYNEAKWHDAAAEFRFAQENAGNMNDWAQALYWVILTELALADYGSALRDMDELDARAINSTFAKDMVYHRARIYFNQGFFEDALILFKRYNDSVTGDDTESTDRKAAAFFWMGECLYAMGQFDDAEKFYSWVITRYPNSLRVEVSSYRIDLIKQKKIEAELLALLRWSHEESLRTSEDYQRRLRTYEFTLNAYQRRIAELTQSGRTQESQIEEIPVPAPEQIKEETSVNGNSGGNVSANTNGRGGAYSGLTAQENQIPAGYPMDALDNQEGDSLVQRAKQLENDIQVFLRQYERSSGGPR